MKGHQDYLLPVPVDATTVIISHRNASVSGRWKGSFAINTWLYSSNYLLGLFTLQLRYQDAEKEHIIDIDQFSAKDKNTILLTNLYALSFCGAVSFAELRVVARTEKAPNVSIIESRMKPMLISAEDYLLSNSVY